MSTFIEQPSYDVTSLSSADDLIAFMRRVDAECAQEQEQRDGGQVWILHVGPDAGTDLVAGVRGGIGCLSWSESDTIFRPENGTNDEPVDYFTWDGHHYVQDPGREVPVDTVYQAVEELVRTRQRPTSIRWVEGTADVRSIRPV